MIDQETLKETIEVLEAIQEMAPRGGSLHYRIGKLRDTLARVPIHQVCQESVKRSESYASQRTRLLKKHLAKKKDIMDTLEEIRDILKNAHIN